MLSPGKAKTCASPRQAPTRSRNMLSSTPYPPVEPSNRGHLSRPDGEQGQTTIPCGVRVTHLIDRIRIILTGDHPYELRDALDSNRQ